MQYVEDLIDDMEDGSAFIPPRGGRSGGWFAFNDETPTAVQSPAPGEPFTMAVVDPARDGSDMAVHVYGNGFANWGAGVGVDLNKQGAVRNTYDASAYVGIGFWARAEDGASTQLRVAVTEARTEADGGICTNCSDNPGQDLNLITSWQYYTVLFEDLAQHGWGDPPVAQLDTTSVYSIVFVAGIATTDIIDFWIDDLALLSLP